MVSNIFRPNYSSSRYLKNILGPPTSPNFVLVNELVCTNNDSKGRAIFLRSFEL